MPDRLPADKLPGTPNTANQSYFDSALRHQVGIRRLSTTTLNDLVANRMALRDKAFISDLRRSYSQIRGLPLDSRSVKAFFRKIERERAASIRLFGSELFVQLEGIILNEADFERRLLEAAIPIPIEIEETDSDALLALLAATLISAGTSKLRTYGQWIDSMVQSDWGRVRDSLQNGLGTGAGTNAAMRQIAGTSARSFQDGDLSVARRNAATLTRTSINHASTIASLAVWEANSDIVGALKYVATLDGRTTPECRSRDGNIAPLPGHSLSIDVPSSKLLQPPTAFPPRHPNCRSRMVAILDGEGIAEAAGSRPYVRSSMTPAKRAQSFREIAQERAGRST